MLQWMWLSCKVELLPIYPWGRSQCLYIGGWVVPRAGPGFWGKRGIFLPLLNRTTIGVGDQHLAPAALPPRKTRFQLYWRLDGSRGPPEWTHRISPPPEFDHLTVRAVANRYTGWAIPAASLITPHGATAPSGPGPPHYRGFATTLRHTTLGRTPLGEWSARCRDLTWQHTTLKRDRRPHRRRHSNPQSGLASGRRPTP
jgi:hypothetical protein